jgi:hypothetical protein
MKRSLLAFASAVLILCATATLTAQKLVIPDALFSRAEKTWYAETTLNAEVIEFCETLARTSDLASVSRFGTTSEGNELVMVILAEPGISSPAEAVKSGKPVIYIQGNIHAGEVEGKEAVQALLRELSVATGPTVLDSIVLLVVPIYNADGNERFGDQARNRGSQNGPALIGLRPNAQELDLNRDYIKVEAPETRASLAAFAQWEPDVFMDLHTTNGSYHGYHLTYSPSLHPAAPLAPFVGDTMLVTIRERMQTRHNFRIFPYGNFTGERGRESLTDTLKAAWVTYEHKPRFGTNYYGLRGAMSILSEAFSHDPFDVRVASTKAFVQEVLSYVAERPREIRARVAAGRAASTFGANGVSPAVPVRSRFWTRPDTQAVLVEVLERLPDSTQRHEPGMPIGLKRSGRFASVRMPVVDRFEAALTRTPPAVGWVIDASVADSVLPRLRLHGVAITRVDAPRTLEVERFMVDSIAKAPRPFQGHQEVTLTGRWMQSRETIPAGSWIVHTGTSRDRLAMLLLEPESDDGMVTWNLLDAGLAVGQVAPVWRVVR